MGATGITHAINSLVKLSRHFYFDGMRWYSRIPLPVENYFITLRIFPLGVWLSILFTLLVFSFLFLGIYKFYGVGFLAERKLRQANARTMDFFLLGIFSVQENDPLPWISSLRILDLDQFKKQSAGIEMSIFFCAHEKQN